MSKLLTCPQGHQWELSISANPANSAGPFSCPVCGVAVERATLGCAEGAGDARTTATWHLGSWAPPVIAGYEIVAELGRGGMGVVYKARQVKLDRLVALKVLPAESCADATFLERFGREARALAKMNHPNIVAVHDFGQAEGQSYLIMEFVEGVSLRQRLRSGRIEPASVLAIARQLCDALDYAHEQGYIHRDIKPENILLDPSARVRVADFGIAKLLAKETANYTLTGPWQVVGTLNCMAPEQFDNPLAVDHRADLYALGVVLYEMLVGELPVGRFALPSQAAGVDALWDAVVLRALEKNPDQRFPSAAAFKNALAHPALTAPCQASEADTAQGPPKLIGVSIFLVLAIIFYPVGLALFIPGLIWLGLVAWHPDRKVVFRRHLATAETALRASGKWFLDTTRCAIITCVLGLCMSILAWHFFPQIWVGGVLDVNGLEIITVGTLLGVLTFLVATSSLKPISMGRPLTIMLAAVAVILATGRLHQLVKRSKSPSATMPTMFGLCR